MLITWIWEVNHWHSNISYYYYIITYCQWCLYYCHLWSLWILHTSLASYPGLNEWLGYKAILFFFELISRLQYVTSTSIAMDFNMFLPCSFRSQRGGHDLQCSLQDLHLHWALCTVSSWFEGTTTPVLSEPSILSCHCWEQTKRCGRQWVLI